MRPIQISVYPQYKTGHADKLETTVDELVSSLCEQEEVDDKHAASAWSPIVYRGARRASEDAVSVCALVYDLDDPTYDFDALRSRLAVRGWRYIMHPTFTAGRYRLVLPLAEDCAAAGYSKLWELVASELAINPDASGKDLGRLFFVPSRPKGSEARAHFTGGDALLALELPNKPAAQAYDLSALKSEVHRLRDQVARARLLELLDGTLRIPAGERESTLHPLLSTLACVTVAPPPAVVEELLRRVLAAREGAAELLETWVSKAMSSYSRGLEFRTKLQTSKGAVTAFFSTPEKLDDMWRTQLQVRMKGDDVVCALPNEHNIILILLNDAELKGTIRFNELRKCIEAHKGPLSGGPGETLDMAATVWFQTSKYKMAPGRAMVGPCLEHVALLNRYDPVQEFLLGLPKWDGKPRLSRMLLDYAAAEGSEGWIELVTRKFFISAMARALKPGCQVDTCLVLQGPQGGGKTSLVRIMSAGFGVETHINLQSKDAQMIAAGAWMVELGELASMKRTDIESVRNYLTRKEDVLRLPYGRTIVTFPRRSVYVGTTNAYQPLHDPDGNRRYWVVSVGKVNTKKLAADRDQLLAEALHAYNKGEPWWLNDAEAVRAKSEAYVYEAEDQTQEALLSYLQGIADNRGKWPESFSAREVAERVLGMPSHTICLDDIRNINRVMTNLGWEKVSKRVVGHKLKCFKVPSQEDMLKGGR